MKISIITFFTLFFLNTYLNSSISNKIIVKVGNEIITQHELENKINTTLVLSKQEIKQENIDKIKSQSLKTLINLKLKNENIRGIIFDLGFSFSQIKDSSKGLSFNDTGRLNMKMGLNNFSAHDVISI